MPGFLDRFSSTPLAILGTHHNLVLFRPATTTRQGETLQYFFIYDARGGCRFPKLLGLPPCREPEFDYTRSDGSLPPPPRRHLLPPCARLLTVDSTSEELWSANPSLPHGVLMFPQVDMDRPHVVHFLYSEFVYVNKNMWVVSIDMSNKHVESFELYVHQCQGRP